MLTLTLSTPLLKVPILLTSSVLTTTAIGPPNRSHTENDRKLRDTDFITRNIALYVFIGKAATVCSLSLASNAPR